MSRIDTAKQMEASEEVRKARTKSAVLGLVQPGVVQEEVKPSKVVKQEKPKRSPGRPPVDGDKNDKTFTMRINSELIEDYGIYCKLKLINSVADGIRTNMEECVSKYKNEIAEAKAQIAARKRK